MRETIGCGERPTKRSLTKSHLTAALWVVTLAAGGTARAANYTITVDASKQTAG